MPQSFHQRSLKSVHTLTATLTPIGTSVGGREEEKWSDVVYGWSHNGNYDLFVEVLWAFCGRSVGVCGRLWASVGVCGRLWASAQIKFLNNGNYDLFVGVLWAFCGRLWASMGVCGRLWASVGACGRLWASVGACGRLLV